MIEYVKGQIAELAPAIAVIDCHGVGYGLNISLNTFSALQGKQEAKLYVYEAIREDAYVLYGFSTRQERALFLLLISVSGIGGNTARMILSALTPAELVNVISSGNDKLLKTVKGIGLKTDVGAGLGKAMEIPEAIRKGKEDAIKKLIEVPLDENKSIPHDYIGKFGSASVLMKKSPEGTGIIAGGPARAVLDLAGFKNIRTKSLGSRNKQNVVLATIEGLKAMKTPEEVAKLRGISVEEVLG